MRISLARLLRDDRGGVAAFVAMVALTAIGAGAVAVDFGRMTVLRSQMQDAADARAMAAAVQLDGRDGAQARAQAVAEDIMFHGSTIPSDDEGEIEVARSSSTASTPRPRWRRPATRTQFSWK